MKKLSALALIVTAGASLTGIAHSANAQNITAAGATFPDPIYERWFQQYKTAHPSVQINYQPIGSGGGIKQLTESTVDFGASDMPMKDDQIKAMKVKPLHFPTVLGGVVVTYNLPGVSQELKFTPELLTDIFMGKITMWNDPRIAKENAGVKLPKLDLVVVHRSDGSGTTFVFTDYLSKVSPGWKSKAGADTSVKWPTGTGQSGNAGVAGMVKNTEGAIGYVELIYALQNHMAYGQLKNSAGMYVKADLNSVTAAAAGAAKEMPADFRVSITNAPGKDAYPISSFTWLLIPSEIKDAAKKSAITAFLKWMLVDGQKDVQQHPELGYAPLPKSVIDKETKQLALIK
jgi:phosphate transport system substrate-binding protein